MKYPGKNYDFISRIIVSRSEIDLGNILGLYGKKKFFGWMEKRFEKNNVEYHSIIKTLCGL